ncbi:MAG: metallophosphoesterase [Phycisphaerae bacterium]|nr:metallophosphoesterase [Phycisphaerae bacterium]
MKRGLIFGLLSLSFVSASVCAQTTQPAEPKDLLVSAKWTYSLDGGKTFSPTPPTIKAETTAEVLARTEFEVSDTAGFVVLELTHGLTGGRVKFSLNGSEVKGPMKGMYYKTIPAIDAKLLKKGKNVLSVDIAIKNVSTRRRKAKDIQLKIAMRLAALKAEHLRIQTGPILGAFGKDYFTVTCRTNMPANVKLIMDGVPKAKIMSHQQTSELGLRHRFRVKMPNLRPDEKWSYHISANRGEQTIATKRWPVRFVPTNEALRFVAMGDSRTYPEKWAKVADVVLKVKPDLVVHSGDMVGWGKRDWEWDEQFFAPAKKLLATIPFYAVIGNHEANATLYNELFYTPSKDGKSRNWSQIVNDVHLIGIDGSEDFSAGSENGKWLEKTLAGSKAEFVFFFSHYPAWSSSAHGGLDKKTGRPREKAVRQAQDVLVPLLTKYKATAYICGHDHCYERSELPGGLTHIISGGAGAPLRKKTENAKKQNPHSKVFASVLHYCLIEINGDTCTMKAVTPNGKVIDKRTWKARKAPDAEKSVSLRR